MRTFYRKSYEIVGWTYEAAVHCNDIHPLFLDQLSDFDYSVTCDDCFEPIE